jgi:flagellar biosynthetic protein FliQ
VTPDIVLSLGRDAAMVMLLVAGPLLGIGLVAGLVISIVQAVTQVQEPSLAFLPKLAAVLVTLALGGSWMLGKLVTYTVSLLANLNAYGP